MPRRRAPRKTDQPRRRLALEALESRAMCAGVPFHATMTAGAIYGALDRPDGSIEVIGVRDYPYSTGPVEHSIGPADQCLPQLPRFLPLSKWTVGTDGSVTGPTAFDLEANATNGFGGIFSPDGAWLAGSLPATTCTGVGLPIIWHPGDGEHVLVELPAGQPTDRALIQGVSNNGTVIYFIDEKYYAWNQTNGFLALQSLYEMEGDQFADGRRFTLNAISADGQTIVGTSGGSGELPYRPTVWRNGVASGLPMGIYSAGFATSVSDDGRVIGGNLRDGMRMIPAVWVEGVLQPIPEISGNFTSYPNILAVDSGLAGDPNAWAALGWDSGRVFAIRSDGVVHEFYRPDDPDNFGLSFEFAPTVRHFSADADSLNLVTHVFSLPAVGDCFGCVYDMTPITQGNVFSIPLSGSHDSAGQYDLDGDQQLSPADALMVINAINENPNKRLSELPELRQAVPKIDVNGDGELSAADALKIINALNEQAASGSPSNSTSSGEGESAAPDYSHELLALAADDFFRDLASRAAYEPKSSPTGRKAQPTGDGRRFKFGKHVRHVLG